MSEVGQRESAVLLFLLEKDWHNMTEIREGTSLGTYALNNAINTLLNLGFLDERRGDRNAREFLLSDKGTEAALAVQKIKNLSEKDN